MNFLFFFVNEKASNRTIIAEEDSNISGSGSVDEDPEETQNLLEKEASTPISPDGSETKENAEEEDDDEDEEEMDVVGSSNEKDQDSDEDKEKKGSEEESDEEEEGEKKVPTDEYGRELSAYEIMRLERIKRNQAYLAGLGLEEEKKRANEVKQKRINEKRKERKMKQKMAEDALMASRRQSMARKSKTKEVDYSGDLKNVLGRPEIIKKKNVEKKPRKSTKKDERLPRFIYLEFERIKKSKNKAISNGKRLVKAAELEVRVAKKNLEAHERRERRKVEKEERLAALESKRMLEPIVRELDRRRPELHKAIKEFNAWEERVTSNASDNRAALQSAISKAKETFPKLLYENERLLGTQLRERLLPESDTGKSKSRSKTKKGKKRKRQENTEEKKEASAPEVSLPHRVTNDEVPSSMKENKAPVLKKSNQLMKTRNVGGPVTSGLASSVQRKWLERDVPVPAEASTDYLPQAGDVIL